jgi:hypothetical protein
LEGREDVREAWSEAKDESESESESNWSVQASVFSVYREKKRSRRFMEECAKVWRVVHTVFLAKLLSRRESLFSIP